jgi:alkyldihydroxyacetonephosphate synthase
MTIAIDHTSLLADLPGEATLDSVETELAAQGMSLGVALAGGVGASTLAEWIARGAPGAASSFADPADHVVAGLVATLPDGRELVIRPSPRRAVGPDLIALAMGTGGHLARVERAWIRVHKKGATRPALPLPGGDLDPPVSDGEARLVAAIARELGAASSRG